MNIIVVSHAHKMLAPLVYNLGDHTLIVTDSYGAPDAFELTAPRIAETAEGEALPDAESGAQTAIFGS